VCLAIVLAGCSSSPASSETGNAEKEAGNEQKRVAQLDIREIV